MGIPYKTYGDIDMEQMIIANKLNCQMYDLVDMTYKNESRQTIEQYKNFSIFCTTESLKSKLGDCWYNKDGSSSIRIFDMEGRNPKGIILITIHEVAHHIDFSNRKYSGHDKEFYAVMKQLLFTALDMGMITKNDVVDEKRIKEDNSRDRGKVVKMMADYVPHPISYKQDVCTISVYNCYAVREHLKKREYQWNGLDKAWTREIKTSDMNSEKDFLISLGISENDIKEYSLKGMAIRQRKFVRLYNVPFENKDVPKRFGYKWNPSGKIKHWEKRIFEDDISEQERNVLEQINDICIEII